MSRSEDPRFESESAIENEPSDSFENELCICCLQPNIPLVKFCRHCRAPLHPLAAMQPYERIYATGFVWRSAVLKPRKLIVVIGIYLYFLPTFLYSILMLKLIFGGISFGELNTVALIATLSALIALAIPSAIALLILTLTTVNYLSRKK